jgi:hypothetical protein
MAIKGKRKSKQRPAPRAPRREPVAPPTPFLRRRWVQVTAAFLVGVAAMTLLVWVTNNLRAGDAEAEANVRAADRRAAATEYQRAVEQAFGAVGVVNPGVPPTVFAEMDAALDQLAQGEAPPGAEATFEEAAKDSASAEETLASFDVVGTVRDLGFEPLQVIAFTASADQLERALDLHGKAADVAAAAVVVGGTEGERLARVAVRLRNSARTELAEGWSQYLTALRAGGVGEGPATGGLVPELPGGGG